MEGRPKGIDFNDVMNVFLNIQGVKRVHNLRIWALTLDKLALSAHLAISKLRLTSNQQFYIFVFFAAPGVNPQGILVEATKNIHDKYNFFEMTLQIEEFQDVMENCSQCKMPTG